MEAFLLLILFQMLGAIIFMSLTYKFIGANRYLGLILSIACLATLSKILLVTFLKEYAITTSISFSLGFSALLYFYIKDILTLKTTSNLTIFLWSIPFLLSVIWFLLAISSEVLQWQGVHEFLTGNTELFSNVRYLIISLYLVLDLRLLFIYRKRFLSLYKKVNYYLILYFTGSLMVLLGLLFLNTVLPKVHTPWITFVGLTLAPFISLIIMYYKIVIPFKNQRYKLNLLGKEIAPIEKPKYLKTDRNSLELEQKKQIILTHLEQDKPYLDLDYAFEDLSVATGLSKHEVSFVLNQYLGGNFYQLINNMRVAYFIEHIDLVLCKEQSILSLAYQSGFSSKSTFNKYFKQVTSVSPTQYLKTLSPLNS